MGVAIMVTGKKSKNVKKAITESKKKDKMKKRGAKLNALKKGAFKEIVVDSNTTLYLSEDRKLVCLKDDPNGFGGAKMQIKLEDGSTKIVIGPFFCRDEDVGMYMSKSSK